MKKLNFIMILFVMLFLTSCEVPTSVKFDNYVDRVEENCDNWTEEEWEMSKEKYRQLLEEYEANYENMTQEERDAINKAIGRYNGILVRKGLEKVDESINGFVDRLPSLFEGFMSAFEEKMKTIRLMKIKYLLTILTLSILMSCHAQTEFKSVDIKEFKIEIAKSDVQIVDVRTVKEYSEGHIPGAMNIDVNAPDFEEKIKVLDKKENVAIYCRSGRRSKMAANKLTAAGYKVIELNTGFLSWDGEVEK